MTVIDIRNVFSERNIELIDIDPSCIYYEEAKNEDGCSELYLLEYNRKTKKERLVMNYSLDDPSFVEHIFPFDKTILLILENGSNSLWLIELDKRTGGELNRRKIVCTGRFRECKALDADHVLICMSSDEENAEVFRKYKEVTDCDCLCYLYNVRTNRKYFVNAPAIARIGASNIELINMAGQHYMVMLDPFADEDTKEHYYREQRWINADIRDNIWIARTEDVVNDIESGNDTVARKCIASADIKALVRYMGNDGNKVYFRAKEFRSNIEKICSYDIASGALTVEVNMQPPKHGYFLIEEKPFRAFSVRNVKGRMCVEGLINSSADRSYDEELGSLVTCMDNRYCVTKKTVTEEDGSSENTYFVIYDTETGKQESYRCSCRLVGENLVLY